LEIPKYRAASSLVKTSLVVKIVFAVIRSATCLISSVFISLILEVQAVRGSGVTSALVFARVLSVQGVTRAMSAVSRCKEIEDRKQKAPTIAHCGGCRGA